MSYICAGALGPGTLTVLVLSADPAHAEAVSSTVRGWPVASAVVVAAAAQEGIGHALLQQPWLVVVDAEVDGFGGWAVARQLLRVRPLIDVLVFDRLGGKLDDTASVWPWDEMPLILDHRMRRHLDPLSRTDATRGAQ